MDKSYRLASNDMEFIFCELKARLRKKEIIKYLSHGDEEQRKIADYLKKNAITVFPYEYKNKYSLNNIEAKKDDNGLIYVKYNGFKIYLKRTYKSLYRAKRYINNILIEQDSSSPHCYITERFSPKEGAVILDIGGAEGFFSLQFIDSVKKIYIFECDENWIQALKETYKNYWDKIEIVNKYVSNVTNEKCIRIDDFVKEKQLMDEDIFIKMDAEGSEIDILDGAKATIESGNRIMLDICVYHCASHEDIVRKRFEGWNIENSEGYMMYYYDYKYDKPYLRRGVLRISK